MHRVFHKQLKRLWMTHPNLSRIVHTKGMMAQSYQWGIEGGSGSPPEISREEAFRWGVREMAKNWNRCKFNFLPLVTPELSLRCSLDILFLRMEEKNYVLQGGDLDRRIHCLFDGMRMIREGTEVPSHNGEPLPDEDPFFCLLQDDELVSEVKIDTGRLLKLPNKEEVDQHDVYLQVTVKLNPVKPSQYGWAF